jgi:hypothetical protein
LIVSSSESAVPETSIPEVDSIDVQSATAYSEIKEGEGPTDHAWTGDTTGDSSVPATSEEFVEEKEEAT